jgi:hypothetical protein
MLNHYVKAIERPLNQLRADQDGVVLIVAACIIAIVSLAFGAGGPLLPAINTAIGTFSAALTTAIAAS